MKIRFDLRDRDDLASAVGGLLAAGVALTGHYAFDWGLLATVIVSFFTGVALSYVYAWYADHRDDKAFEDLVQDGLQYYREDDRG